MFSFQGTSWVFKETQWSFSVEELQSISLFRFKKWWAKMDSNHRPHDYQSCALASWAIGPYRRNQIHNLHILCKHKIFDCGFVSPLPIKPASLGFNGSPEALFTSFLWWRLAGSNRWPPACKAGALPAELNPHLLSHSRCIFSVPSKLNNALSTEHFVLTLGRYK